jgi:hypothetical protein
MQSRVLPAEGTERRGSKGRSYPGGPSQLLSSGEEGKSHDGSGI